MSQINVDKVAARTGGAPTFPSGLNLVGVTTGLSVSGIATFADSTTSTSVDLTSEINKKSIWENDFGKVSFQCIDAILISLYIEKEGLLF